MNRTANLCCTCISGQLQRQQGQKQLHIGWAVLLGAAAALHTAGVGFELANSPQQGLPGKFSLFSSSMRLLFFLCFASFED